MPHDTSQHGARHPSTKTTWNPWHEDTGPPNYSWHKDTGPPSKPCHEDTGPPRNPWQKDTGGPQAAPAAAGTHRALAQGVLHLGEVPHGAPDLGDEALLGDVQAALVEDEVDGLHLLHLHPPRGQRLHHLVQHLRQVLLRLLQHLRVPKKGGQRWVWGGSQCGHPPQMPSRCPAHHAEVLDLAEQPVQRFCPAGLALRVGVDLAVEAGTDGQRRVGEGGSSAK